MRKRVFGARATVYGGAERDRRVLEGVFLRRRMQREARGGTFAHGYVLRMTAPWKEGAECPVKTGDLIVPGIGPEEYAAEEMAALREEGRCFVVVRIEDNTGQPGLKYWRIEAE